MPKVGPDGDLPASPARDERAHLPSSIWGPLGLLLAIGLGAVLRLIWLEDCVFRWDEAYSMDRVLNVGRSETWPATGQLSSAGITNCGLSVWFFVVVGRLTSAETPPDLSRGVALCSILAMLLYLPFIRRLIRREESEAWYWGVALMALSPLAVFLNRRIWQPSLFPLLTLALLAAWMTRDRRAGAFAFGIVGALIGQMHFAGFFLAAAMVGWVLFFDRGSMRLAWWFVGSVLGAIPLIPWIIWNYQHFGTYPANEAASWVHPLKGLFALRWFVQPFGFETMNHALGRNFWDFLRYPLVGGHPTFLVGILHAASAVLFVVLAIPIIRRWRRLRTQWLAMFVGRESATAFTSAAAFWGFGLLFALTRKPSRYYYMLVNMPLVYVASAQRALSIEPVDRPLISPRRCLLALCVVQALLSAAFLHYVHVQDRALGGDYGLPYRLQKPYPATTP